MVGTGAAALTGLVFVAMSLNVGAVKGDTAHRYRASGSLTGLASVFVLSGLVLMGGQHHQAVGAEVLIVAAGAATFFVWRFLHTRRFSGSDAALSVYRSLGSTICYFAEMAGAALLIGGDSLGLYLVAVGIMVNFYFMISGAWLLLVCAEDPDPPRDTTSANEGSRLPVRRPSAARRPSATQTSGRERACLVMTRPAGSCWRDDTIRPREMSACAQPRVHAKQPRGSKPRPS
jgi:hypothetical protein